MEPLTRSQLHSFEVKQKREELLVRLQPVYRLVKQSAISGKTQIFIQIREVHRNAGLEPFAKEFILETWDIPTSVELLKELFPDSKVELQESWVNASPTNRVLKKYLLIDWS